MKVKCKHCTAEVEVSKDHVGKMIQCPQCGKAFLCIPKRRKLEAKATDGSTFQPNFSCGIPSGRVSRSEWWRSVLVMFGCIWAVVLLFLFAGNGLDGVLMGGVAFTGGSLASIFVTLPVSINRFHDMDMSGAWIVLFGLLAFVPCLGFISSLIYIILLGCIMGTPGPNKYGPDPLGQNKAQQTQKRPSRVKPQVGNDC